MTQAGGPSAEDASEDAISHSVRFEDGAPEFTASGGEPILAAAARAGLVLPSACRSGTCRTCMCRLTRGEVAYRIQWPGLLPEEKAQGYILPCIAHARSDLVLRRDKPHVDWRERRDRANAGQ